MCIAIATPPSSCGATLRVSVSTSPGRASHATRPRSQTSCGCAMAHPRIWTSCGIPMARPRPTSSMPMNIPLRRYWSLLVAYLRPQRHQVAGLALLLIGGIALQLANPQILRAFIDSAVAGGAPEALTMLALLFIGVALLAQVISIVATYLGEKVSWTATNALRADLAAHCLRLDLSFHKARTPGELIERIDGDVNALANFFSQFFIHMLGNLALVVGVLALLFREDWRIGLAMTAFALGALIILIRIRSFALPYWAQVRETSATFFGSLGEHISVN